MDMILLFFPAVLNLFFAEIICLIETMEIWGLKATQEETNFHFMQRNSYKRVSFQPVNLGVQFNCRCCEAFLWPLVFKSNMKSSFETDL